MFYFRSTPNQYAYFDPKKKKKKKKKRAHYFALSVLVSYLHITFIFNNKIKDTHSIGFISFFPLKTCTPLMHKAFLTVIYR